MSEVRELSPLQVLGLRRSGAFPRCALRPKSEGFEQLCHRSLQARPPFRLAFDLSSELVQSDIELALNQALR